MNHACLFKMATKRLIQRSVETPDVDSTPLPSQVRDAMNHKRRLARERIAFDLPRLGFLNDSVWWTSLHNAFRTPRSPGDRLTPGASIECIEKLHAVVTDSQLAVQMVALLTALCDGLCLTCVRERPRLASMLAPSAKKNFPPSG
ncbi:hypothetical protein AC579_9852 [Pseudocercospora musae]|nr:hypothetical protein AC579_9852 [Pseudocercospora musae]